MEIREVTLADADGIFELLKHFATSYAPQRDAFDRTFPRLISSPDTIFLTAIEGGESIGYLLGFVFPTLYANGPLLELQELMVASHARGRGIGRLLVEDAGRMAWGRGCVEITVPTRRAAAFYERLGFEETAAYFKWRRPVDAGDAHAGSDPDETKPR